MSLPWCWRHYTPLTSGYFNKTKGWYISQKAVIFIPATMRTWNHTCKLLVRLQGGMIQTISCTGAIFWSTVRLHLSSSHTDLSTRALWLQQRYLSSKARSWREMSLNFDGNVSLSCCAMIINMLWNLTPMTWSPSPPHEVVLPIFIDHKNPSSLAGPVNVSPMASTITTRPPRTTNCSSFHYTLLSHLTQSIVNSNSVSINLTIKPLKPSSNYMNHLLWQSVMLHFVFIGFIWSSL
jgi:hypothetical protein